MVPDEIPHECDSDPGVLTSPAHWQNLLQTKFWIPVTADSQLQSEFVAYKGETIRSWDISLLESSLHHDACFITKDILLLGGFSAAA